MESSDDNLSSSGRVRRPRATATVSKNKTQETRPKKRKAEVSVEVLYKQENYKEVCPTALETIFESPSNAKRRSSGRESRKRESSKGFDSENFGLQKVKRFCLFGCYYYPTKQKENIRKSKAKKIEKKGIKIPRGGVITNEDVQAALANLSDDENDLTVNETILNSTQNTTLDPNDLFDFKTPTKQGYKKTKEEDTSMFYSGNIIKPDETLDALIMEDTLKNMMKNMDLDELKDIKLPFADESNELEIDDVALKIPDFFDSDTTLGFESKGKKSRRRSGRVTDARSSGIFMPLSLEEIKEISESETKKTPENYIIPGNTKTLIECDQQDNALEGRISRRGRASNSSIKFDSFFEENSLIACANNNKKSRRRSGRVDIMKNINITQISKDEENLIKDVTEISLIEGKGIKDSVRSTENESLPVDIAVENRNMEMNLNKPENGIRRGRRSNASSQYTTFFEEVSPIASTRKVKKSRRLLDEIQTNDIQDSPKSELLPSPIKLVITVNNEPPENVEGKTDITHDRDILESDLIDTKKPTSKKRRGPQSARGKRRVSGVKRLLYRKIVDSSLSSPNSSINNSTDTSLQISTIVGSMEALITSPSTLMAELTIKSPNSETSRGRRRSTRSMSSNHAGNMERIVESENVLISNQEKKETSKQKLNLLTVPLNLKRTSSKDLKSNDVRSIQLSSTISLDDSSDVKKSLKENKSKNSSSQCRTAKSSDDYLVLSSAEEALNVTDVISMQEIPGSFCGIVQTASAELYPEDLSKTHPTGDVGHTATGGNIGESSGKIKKIKLSDVLIGSKMKGRTDKSKHSSSKIELTMGKSSSEFLGEKKVEFDEQFSNEINSPIITGIFHQKMSIREGKLYRNKENIVKESNNT